MYCKNEPSHRRGAALMIALVLLACLTIVAGTMLPQILRSRHESRQELLREQSRQLLEDALRIAEAKRQGDPDFSGMVWTLGPDEQPFPGTFLVTTRLEGNTFAVEVEFRNDDGKTICVMNRNPNK
jgi:type II secretory pathway component PulJ